MTVHERGTPVASVTGSATPERKYTPYTLHPTPFTLTPCTLHPTPYTLHPTPYTLHTTPHHTTRPTHHTTHPNTPRVLQARGKPEEAEREVRALLDLMRDNAAVVQVRPPLSLSRSLSVCLYCERAREGAREREPPSCSFFVAFRLYIVFRQVF